MHIRHSTVNYLQLLVVVILANLLISQYSDFFDIFQTDRFYLNWFEALNEIKFGVGAFSEYYTASIKEISAPEPLASIIVVGTLVLLPVTSETLFDTYSIIFLVLYLYLVTSSSMNLFIKLILIISMVIGYYEFTLMYSTHRLKIAVILVLMSLITQYKYSRLSDNLFAASFWVHFSLFSIIPILFILKWYGFRFIKVPKLFHLSIWGVGVFSILVVSSFYDDGTLLTGYGYLGLEGKLKHVNIDEEQFIMYLTLSILIGYVISLFKDKLKLLLLLIAMLYFVGSLLVVGTSVLLYTYYVLMIPILVSVYSYCGSSHRILIAVAILPMVLYSLYRGFQLAPVPIIQHHL